MKLEVFYLGILSLFDFLAHSEEKVRYCKQFDIRPPVRLCVLVIGGIDKGGEGNDVGII